MRTVNIHEAKTHLSRLVDKAARGESFVIAKSGKPLVKVMALEAPAAAETENDKAPKMMRRIQIPRDARCTSCTTTGHPCPDC